MTLHWTSDGSGAVSADDETESTVTISSTKPGTPCNVRHTTPHLCFSVKISELEGNVSVGLVAGEDFLPGWKVRGMFYNGNVTNGSGALIVGFGKYVRQAGDTVGVAQRKVNDDTTEVEFVMNGKKLGTAFRLDAANGGTKIFYPCVHVSGTAKFVFKVVPDAAALEASLSDGNSEEGYVGDWKVEALTVDGAVVDLPPDPPVVLSLEGRLDNPGTLYIKVANSMRCSINVTIQGEARQASNNDEQVFSIQTGHVASTRMLPPPPLAGIERAFGEAIPRLSSMMLKNHQDELVLKSEKDEIVAKRYQKTFEHLTTYK